MKCTCSTECLRFNLNKHIDKSGSSEVGKYILTFWLEKLMLLPDYFKRGLRFCARGVFMEPDRNSGAFSLFIEGDAAKCGSGLSESSKFLQLAKVADNDIPAGGSITAFCDVWAWASKNVKRREWANIGAAKARRPFDLGPGEAAENMASEWEDRQVCFMCFSRIDSFTSPSLFEVRKYYETMNEIRWVKMRLRRT